MNHNHSHYETLRPVRGLLFERGPSLGLIATVVSYLCIQRDPMRNLVVVVLCLCDSSSHLSELKRRRTTYAGCRRQEP